MLYSLSFASFSGRSNAISASYHCVGFPLLKESLSFSSEGLPGVLGNKGTKGKYCREQGNMTPVLVNAET